MRDYFSKPCLLDTNILIHAHQVDHPNHQATVTLVTRSINGELEAVLAHQNLTEFCRVATEKKMMAKPLSAKQAAAVIRYYTDSSIRIIQPESTTLTMFAKILATFQLKNSKQVFDLYLAATMLTNDITTILTENVKDFRDFPGIQAVNPFD